MKVETKKEILKEILYILRTIVICSVAVFLCVKFLVTPVVVDGDSMRPTIKDNEFGFSFVLSSLFGNYHRFDVVVVNYQKENKDLVKRIIGLPGEKVEYKDDKLYINDNYIEEDFFDQEWVDKNTFGGALSFTDDYGPIVLRENEYFLVGDNRLNSADSRLMGPFEKKDITSKYMFVLYPFDSLRFANGH